MDLAVRCSRKAVKLNHSLTHSHSLMSEISMIWYDIAVFYAFMLFISFKILTHYGMNQDGQLQQTMSTNDFCLTHLISWKWVSLQMLPLRILDYQGCIWVCVFIWHIYKRMTCFQNPASFVWHSSHFGSNPNSFFVAWVQFETYNAAFLLSSRVKIIIFDIFFPSCYMIYKQNMMNIPGRFCLQLQTNWSFRMNAIILPFCMVCNVIHQHEQHLYAKLPAYTITLPSLDLGWGSEHHSIQFCHDIPWKCKSSK